MNNFISLIEKELLINKNMNFAERIIKLLFDEIRNTKDIDDAELLFKNLEDVQFILAKAVFKENQDVSSFLRQFIYDFDRIDDEDVKKDLYSKINMEQTNGGVY